MAVVNTPLGFQVPDGNDPIRNGDNVIAANASLADTLLLEARANIANLLTAAGFPVDPIELNDDAVAEALAAGGVTSAAMDARLGVKVPPLVAAYIAADPSVVTAAATMAQSTVGLVPVWKASTAYVAGQRVIAPNGDVVSAKVNFTSSASYNATNWNASTQDGRIGSLEALRMLPTITVASGTDVDTLRTPGRYLVNTIAIASSLINAPSTRSAIITVESTTGGTVSQVWTDLYGTDNGLYKRTTSALTPIPYPFGPWADLRNPGKKVTAITANTDMDTVRTPGFYSVSSNSIAATLLNYPTVAGGSAQPSEIEVKAGSTGLVYQEVVELYASGTGGTVFSRSTSSIGTTPYPFGPWWDHKVAPAAPATSDAGLTNMVLVQDASRRRGGIKKTGGKGAVAFRFDHGLTNYVNLLLPLMQARNFKHSQALNSRAWALSENTGVTQSDVNTLVTSGILEIWNHGALNHSDADTLAKLNDSIVNGLAELRSQIPAAQIDGWVVPGVTGTLYMGFNGGITPDKLYGTDAGKIILSSHAYTTGGISGTYQRTLDGVVRQGQHQYTLDDRTVADAKAEIDLAVANKTGLQFMLHPSVVNTTDKMSVAMFTEILDYVVTKQAAGSLVVLSPYEIMTADSRL